MGTAATQGELWGAKAQYWANLQEPAWRLLFEKVMAQAGVTQGMQLLDIGCGAGGALQVARALGADVAGLDASAALVDIARKRLPGARIEVGEMEQLPFDSGAFDVVTGINSFQFAGDIGQALREAQRVTKHNGKVLMLVWGRKDDCQLLSATMPAVVALLPPPRNSTPSIALAESGIIEGLMSQGGLSLMTATDIDHSLCFSDAQTAWRAISSAAPCVRAVRHAGESRVKQAVLATLAPFTLADGSVCLQNRFRLVIGTRFGQPESRF